MQSTYGSSGSSQELDARDPVQTVVDRGRQAVDAMQRTADSAYDSAKRTVQDQPALATLGVFAFGVLFGAALMSASRRSTYYRFLPAPSHSPIRDWQRRHNF